MWQSNNRKSTSSFARMDNQFHICETSYSKVGHMRSDNNYRLGISRKCIQNVITHTYTNIHCENKCSSTIIQNIIQNSNFVLYPPLLNVFRHYWHSACAHAHTHTHIIARVHGKGEVWYSIGHPHFVVDKRAGH